MTRQQSKNLFRFIFATAAFPDGAALAEAKMGALLSFIAAPFAFIASRVLGLRKVVIERRVAL